MIIRLTLIAILFCSFISNVFANASTQETPNFIGLYFGIGSGFYIPDHSSHLDLSVPSSSLSTTTHTDPLAFTSAWSMGHLWSFADTWRIGAEFQWRILGGISSHNSNTYQLGTTTGIYDIERDASWAMQYVEDVVIGKVVTPNFFLFTKLGIASEVMETHTTVVTDAYSPTPINHYGEMYMGGNLGFGASWLLAKQISFTLEYADSFFQTSTGKTDIINPNSFPGMPPLPPLTVKQKNLFAHTQNLLLSLNYFFS